MPTWPRGKLNTVTYGLLGLFLFLGAVAPAQRTTATIHGATQDPSQAAVINAAVRIVNKATGAVPAAGADHGNNRSVAAAGRIAYRESSRPTAASPSAWFQASNRVWFSANAFAVLPTNAACSATVGPGHVGKKALRAPGQWNMDISISKNLAISERVRLQIRADAFNSFHNVNLGSPVLDVRNANFGRILSVAEARRMRSNARLTF